MKPIEKFLNLFPPADPAGPRTYFLSRWFFLKLLAIVYLAAFSSLWIQIDGLVGERGILPVHAFLQSLQKDLGSRAFWFFPSLCWLNDSDGFLHFLCGAGVALSVLLLLDLLPGPCLFLLWGFYLSLVCIGQDFLSFQWDYLLLETGFLSLFLVPWNRWRLGRGSSVPLAWAVFFLFQWLLFRFMFSSGVVKLTSHDETWWNLTALTYHYETQPLPTSLAWFMNQAPLWFQKSSCFYMFLVELAVPFFIFGPRRLRPFAFWSLVSLQLLIMATGNYCFFNWLTLGLCLFILEDSAWPGWARKRLTPSPIPSGQEIVGWSSWVRGSILAFVFLGSVLQTVMTLGFELPPPLAVMVEILEPLRSVNSYGLFRVMTKTRPEIIVEGSNDGRDWEPYGFKWKAGELGRMPAYVAPYQPRLDWQMWFAALGDYRQNPWFVWFLVRLLQGSPDVSGLLEADPFPRAPPRFIRAELYEYHFTDFQERSRTGNWWKREWVREYIPAFSLQGLREP